MGLGRVAAHVQFLLLELLKVLIREVIVAVHLVEHGIAALLGSLGVEHGAVGGGSLQKSHKHGGFVDIKLRRGLVEEGFRSGLDAIGIAAEIYSIEIHGNDFLLRIVVLQFHGDHPLLEFREHRPEEAVVLAGEEVLGQLLGDGGAAARRAVSSKHGLEEHAEKRTGVDAGMFVESHILRGNEGVDKVRRELLIGDVRAVLETNVAQHLAIVAQHFGGLQATGILQLLERGHETYPSQRKEEEEEDDERPHTGEHLPHGLDILRLFALFVALHGAVISNY